MSIGLGLLVIALGAIFRFAVPHSPSGLDLHVVGVVGMTVGAVGLFLRLAGYGPDSGIVTLPRWRGSRTRMVEERVYDPMAEDPTVYRPADELANDHLHTPTTHPVVVRHEEHRYEQ